MTTTPCTVVTGATGGRCGEPAVTTFTTRTGTTYAECAAHAVTTVPAAAAPATETAATLGLRTATARPYVLVAHGAIVGYAETTGPAVVKRAARLGARIIPTR